jgi:hypothetical protein
VHEGELVGPESEPGRGDARIFAREMYLFDNLANDDDQRFGMSASIRSRGGSSRLRALCSRHYLYLSVSSTRSTNLPARPNSTIGITLRLVTCWRSLLSSELLPALDRSSGPVRYLEPDNSTISMQAYLQAIPNPPLLLKKWQNHRLIGTGRHFGGLGDHRVLLRRQSSVNLLAPAENNVRPY